ncbi:hypothetical protein TrLO_g3524 [Triparma laevis f. longispina]|uniref:Uncharacterized protein n=1 Tax=Triparma laevis f. longispina TaxID=1714387 RepID=A0A9W7F9J2_9STRA|nr:hypothetical protein TrLO_g3524 [Triparma laevis f. longispina]
MLLKDQGRGSATVYVGSHNFSKGAWGDLDDADSLNVTEFDFFPVTAPWNVREIYEEDKEAAIRMLRYSYTFREEEEVKFGGISVPTRSILRRV